MNMRSKLIATLTLTVILPILAIASLSISKTISSSSENFIQGTQNEIRQVDKGFQLFLQQVKNNALFLANNAMVKAAPAHTQNYLGQERMIDPSKGSKQEAAIFDLYTEFGLSHDELLYVYMGLSSGGFIQYPAEKLGGYDPRQRPWYKLATANPGKAMLTSAYQGVTGGPMVSVAAAIKNNQGQVIGAQSLDVTLSTLTDILNQVKLGESGYLLLIDETGTILADPNNPKNNFKQLKQLSSPLFEILRQTQGNISFSTEHMGTEVDVTTYSSQVLGWRFVGIINTNEIMQPAYKMSGTIVLIALLMVAIFVGMGVWLANKIILPINTVAEGLKDIAQGQGDLTKRLEVVGNDEISQLARWFNQFLDSIHNLVLEIKTRAITLGETASESNTKIADIKTSSHQQENAIDNSATSIQQLAAKAEQISTDCNSSMQSVQDTETSAHAGNSTIASTVEQVNNLSASLGESATAIQLLEQESDNITQILSVIRGIAEQTNLLALNAAIEAARAGEQGRGFAVVADEVRTLAQRSRESTEEIDGVLNNLLEQTRIVSTKMTSSVDISTQAISQTQEARQSFDEISGSVESIKQKTAQIASAATEQFRTAENINTNISGISQSAHGVGNNADTLEQSSNQLVLLSAELNELVGRFKVKA